MRRRYRFLLARPSLNPPRAALPPPRGLTISWIYVAGAPRYCLPRRYLFPRVNRTCRGFGAINRACSAPVFLPRLSVHFQLFNLEKGGFAMYRISWRGDGGCWDFVSQNWKRGTRDEFGDCAGDHFDKSDRS